MKRRVLSGIVFTLIIIGLLGGLLNRQWIKDKYIVSRTELQAQSAQLLPDLVLTSDGEFLYRASQPEVQQSDKFSASCKNVSHEHSIVLGCYTQQRFYVFDVTDERLAGVKQVTAAHELLHAIYERLSTKDREELNVLLNETANSIQDKRFNETIEQYRRTEPDQIENEIHSILATEIEVLPAKLEAHYAKYFKNRSQIVSYAKQYEAAFTELDTQIKQYDSQLNILREQKVALEASLDSQNREILAERTLLNELRSSDVRAYNNAVPEFNASIRDYKTDGNRLQQIVDDFNALAAKRNQLVTTQNDLMKQLDSNYQDIE